MDDFADPKKKNDIEFSDSSTKQEEFENLEIISENKSSKNDNYQKLNTSKSEPQVGRVLKALYYNGEPIIVIGPHCIII